MLARAKSATGGAVSVYCAKGYARHFDFACKNIQPEAEKRLEALRGDLNDSSRLVGISHLIGNWAGRCSSP